MFKAVIAAAIAGAAVPSAAQDVPATFNGLFVGAQAGWQQDRRSFDATFPSASTPISGFAYGAQIGYDWRLFDSVVLGAEVDITGSSGNPRFSSSQRKPSRSIAATARLGFLTDPQGLVYVRGGYRNAKFSFLGLFGDTFSGTSDGYTIGAGYERYLAPNISARLEYAYTMLEKDSRFLNNEVETFDNYRHNVMAGVNFRF